MVGASWGKWRCDRAYRQSVSPGTSSSCPSSSSTSCQQPVSSSPGPPPCTPHPCPQCPTSFLLPLVQGLPPGPSRSPLLIVGVCCFFADRRVPTGTSWRCEDGPVRWSALGLLCGMGGNGHQVVTRLKGPSAPSSLMTNSDRCCGLSALISLDISLSPQLSLLVSLFLKYNINIICRYSLRDTYYVGILVCFTNLVVIMASKCLDFKTLFARSFESWL